MEFITASASNSSATGTPLARDIDPIDRAIERRVGVDVAAGVLDALRKLARAARRRALEKHVLEHVREPGAEVPILVNAARFHPDLHAGHRRAVILLHDDAQAVRKRPGARIDGGKLQRRTRLRRNLWNVKRCPCRDAPKMSRLAELTLASLYRARSKPAQRLYLRERNRRSMTGLPQFPAGASMRKRGCATGRSGRKGATNAS